jgi:hypothetical protein
MTVAALFVDRLGPYPKMGDWHAPASPTNPRIDCWTVERDARLYRGPWPVVAHPPCGPWGRLRHLYKGNEHGCAPIAVGFVRTHGGVLEHPAGSLLWRESALPEPGDPRGCDAFHGYTIEIDQCEWGHVARKRTWLYLVGIPREALEAPPFPGREPTHWISGGRGRVGKKAKTTPVPPGIKVASACQRRRTPPLLAEYLVRLARAASVAHSRNDWRPDEPARAGREESDG